MSSTASEQLSKWIEWISNSRIDPWPNGKVDSNPLDPDSQVIDPTQNFFDISDEWTDDGSSQVSLKLSKQTDKTTT